MAQDSHQSVAVMNKGNGFTHDDKGVTGRDF